MRFSDYLNQPNSLKIHYNVEVTFTMGLINEGVNKIHSTLDIEHLIVENFIDRIRINSTKKSMWEI
jgi:hypothetical protein